MFGRFTADRKPRAGAILPPPICILQQEDLMTLSNFSTIISLLYYCYHQTQFKPDCSSLFSAGY